MTDSERLEEIWAKLHGGSQVTADEIVFLESEHSRTVQSYHKALEERWGEIVEKLAELERLRERVRELEGTVTAGLLATEQISRALKPYVAKLAAVLEAKP